MMHNRPDISVIISTHNRCDGIRDTLASLVSQDKAGGLRYEVLAVDNNSTDRTRDVIEEFASRHAEIRYLYEPQQGVSYGRNAAIPLARAPILAFTDDDVIVEPDWLRAITRTFERYPRVDYVTGRMVAICEADPPAWMMRGNTSACVLRDRGPVPQISRPGHYFPGWATANIAFRREVFDRIGLFSGDFPRGQDLEFIIRLWQAGGCGVYAPDVVVSHKITRERMTKAYHRMWHTREGDIRARVRFREIITADGRVLHEPPPARLIFGVPAFLYRELVTDACRWVGAALRLDEGAAFQLESQLRQTVSYIRTRARQRALPPAQPRVEGVPGASV